MKKVFVVQLSLCLAQIFIFCLLPACEKSALTTASDSLLRPIVEAYLTPGRPPKVKVTYQLAFGNTDDTVQTIDNLQVFIESGAISYPLQYVAADTAYVADNTWPVEAGKTYRLYFEYDGQTVSAQSVVPPKPTGFVTSATSISIPKIGNPGSGGSFPTFPDPIEMSWENNDGAYYLVVVENLETNPEAIFEDSGNSDRPRFSFRSEPEQTNVYEVGFQNFQYYGTHRVILFRIQAEYASLYDDNGNSSQNLSTPYSNVSGGLGIFTGINADTLLIEVTK